MKQNCNPAHDPRTCHLCGPLRHPSHLETRRALADLPQQKAPRADGGSR